VDVNLGNLDELSSNSGAPALVLEVAKYAQTIGMIGGEVNMFLRIRRTE